jgi:hypothetical protein
MFQIISKSVVSVCRQRHAAIIKGV